MRALTYTLLLCLSLLGGCIHQPSGQTAGDVTALRAEAWHEADRLFYNNPDTPQWKGADVANSVALGDGRILWVFGDTLLAQPGANRCERFDEFAITVHNSIAVQQGSDPTTASIEHFWRETEDEPVSFFESNDIDSWYWIGGVTVFGDKALVFLMRAQSSVAPVEETVESDACAGLDFTMTGWDARIATITPQSPDTWEWQSVELPQQTHWHGILAGSSTASVDQDFLYAWSSGPAVFGGNPVYLARWNRDDANAGNLGEPQWYTNNGWKTQGQLGNTPPTVIVADGNNEISVCEQHMPGNPHGWWWLQSREVIRSPLCYRYSDSLNGFSECRSVYTPPELSKYPDSSLLIYAAKWHPALTSDDGSAIGTYVVNSCNLRDIQDKCDLYYPRFIRLGRPGH